VTASKKYRSLIKGEIILNIFEIVKIRRGRKQYDCWGSKELRQPRPAERWQQQEMIHPSIMQMYSQKTRQIIS